LKPRLSWSGVSFSGSIPEKVMDHFMDEQKLGVFTMFRRILIIFVMTPLLIAAVAAEISLPVLLMMISLFLIALTESSARDEQVD